MGNLNEKEVPSPPPPKKATSTKDLINIKGEVFYTLQLEDRKWYVGRTKNMKRRYQEHLDGKGAVWTEKHPPVRIYSVIPMTDSLMEDLLVKRLMSKHGIDNVRGGTYSTIKLDTTSVRILTKELCHADGKCFTCGSSSHYAKDCKVLRQDYEANTKPYCATCGRPEHYKDTSSSRCWFKTDRDGDQCKGRQYCKRCGYKGHTEDKCYTKKTYDNIKL